MVSRLNPGILLKRLLIGALLAGIFSVFTLGVIYFSLRGRTVEVPNVVGKSESEASDELEDYGLRMQVNKNRAHNSKVAPDTISDQYPAPGTVVKTGQLVRVSISLGSPPGNGQGN